MFFERHMTGEAVECCRPQVTSAGLTVTQSAPYTTPLAHTRTSNWKGRRPHFADLLSDEMDVTPGLPSGPESVIGFPRRELAGLASLVGDSCVRDERVWSGRNGWCDSLVPALGARLPCKGKCCQC